MLPKRSNFKLAVLLAAVLFSGTAWASGGWHQFWNNLGTSTYIQIGNGKTVVYDFFDPNCVYCAEAFKRELPAIQSGQLTVRYVPVAILAASSLGKAAAILESHAPAHDLAVDFQGVMQNGSGGVRAITPSDQVRAGIGRNLQLLMQTGNDIVPDLVFRLPDGHVGMIRGLFPVSALDAIVAGQMP